MEPSRTAASLCCPCPRAWRAARRWPCRGSEGKRVRCFLSSPSLAPPWSKAQIQSEPSAHPQQPTLLPGTPQWAVPWHRRVEFRCGLNLSLLATSSCFLRICHRPSIQARDTGQGNRGSKHAMVDTVGRALVNSWGHCKHSRLPQITDRAVLLLSQRVGLARGCGRLAGGGDRPLAQDRKYPQHCRDRPPWHGALLWPFALSTGQFLSIRSPGSPSRGPAAHITHISQLFEIGPRRGGTRLTLLVSVCPSQRRGLS